jgi:2-polyprenyl-3-methyl-5-hydroxy-6-metoxy-1,4-benzoquinol methylase
MVVQLYTKSYFLKTKRYKEVVAPRDPEVDLPLVTFLQNNLPNGAKILEVGGGSGYLLKLIGDRKSFNLFNVEIVPEVYKLQADPSINLIGGDALKLPFRNGSFDCVIIKSVLHHLVGKTRKESKLNAYLCIRELKRVTKGFIVISELYNEDRFASFLLFYITKFLSRLNIGLPFMGYDKGVIVSMLTPTEIFKFLKEENTEFLFSKKIRYKVLLRQYITGLWRNVGIILIISKIYK